MHDSRQPIKVEAHHNKKCEDVEDDYDMFIVTFEQEKAEITLYFRDLDHLVDMVRSLARQVSEIRHLTDEPGARRLA